MPATQTAASPPPSPLAGVDPTTLLADMARDRAEAQDEGASALKAAQAAVQKMNEAAPQPQRTPPEQYSGVAMAIASLGGLLTHAPLTTAANAMTGVLNAYQQGDAARSQQQFDQWKTAHEAAVKTAELEMKAYEDASKKMQNDPRGYQSEMLALTAAFKNDAIGRYANQGNWQMVDALVAGMRGALKGLGTSGEGFSDSHGIMSSVADAEKSVDEAAKSGDKAAYATAIDNLNEQRDRLATAVETGQISKLPKGVSVAELRKPIPGGTAKGPQEGSENWTRASIADDIKKQHPDWTPGQVATETERQLKSAKGGTTAAGVLTQNAMTIAQTEISRREAAGETVSAADKAIIENSAIQAALRNRTAFSQTVGYQQGEMLSQWAKEHPYATLQEFAQAEHEIQGKDIMTPAQTSALEDRSLEISHALDAADRMRESLANATAVAGGLGRILRPGETIGNVTGLMDTTYRANFQSAKAQLELVAGNILASKESAALPASKKALLETIVRGGNWGDTYQNVTAALDTLDSIMGDELKSLNRRYRDSTGRDLDVMQNGPTAAAPATAPAAANSNVIRYDAQGNRIP